MATAKQIAFFGELLDDREFPDGTDFNKLRADFAQVSDKSASAWIEKALMLPKRDDSDKPLVPPPF
jgi:hypothetical protein